MPSRYRHALNAFLLLQHFIYSTGQPLFPIALNQSVQGTTLTISNNIFSGFSKHDVLEKVGLAEQVVFQFNITFAGAMTVIHLSTCLGSDFDTYLVLFANNPLKSANATVIAESANDILCPKAIERASLTATLPAGTYYTLLTGNGNSSGFYNLSIMATVATPAPLPWSLDRIDQRRLPLNEAYSVTDGADGIYIYLIDSGVNAEHSEFEGRVEAGYDFVRGSNESTPDCTGHGTHAAATICGRTYGVAKKARLIPIRVFGCNHQTNAESIINAINWVLIDSGRRNIRHKSIIVMLFSVLNDRASVLQPSILSVVDAKIPTVVSAGDNGASACDYLPASTDGFITVGATNKVDARPDFSNFGDCVDVYAPGVDVPSAWHSSTNAVQISSGTSKAAAIVAGAAALLLSLNGNIGAEVVHELIEAVGTPDIVWNVAGNESTRLVYVRSVPKYSGPMPAKGSVYLFTVLLAELPSCAPGARQIRAIRETLANVLSVEEEYVITNCNKSNIVVRGLSVRQEGEEEMVHIQMEVAERKASAGFLLLERALKDDASQTKNSFGFSFTVANMPWAVDSRNVVYWGAPLFPDIARNGFSLGALIAIIFSILFFCSLIGVIVWLLHRHRTRQDEIESMEGSMDYERGPIRFYDFESDDGEMKRTRSFRAFKKTVSFRRSGSVREGRSSSMFGGERGLNRMSSFVGGGGEDGDGSGPVAKDMVRVQSFGGEAFAAMSRLETSESTASGETAGSESDDGEAKSWRASSNKGQHNWMLSRKNTNMMGDLGNEGGEIAADEMMKMKSYGGEAFAMLANMPSMKPASNDPGGDYGSPSSALGLQRSDLDALNEGFMSPNDADENRKKASENEKKAGREDEEDQ